MKAMILAAGRGARMRPLTDTLPKPLLPVANKPLIVHHLEKLKKLGITEVVINISYLAEKIQMALGDGSAYGLQITYSYEPEVLETGGGILQALPHLGNEPFIVISADIWTDYDFNKLIRPLSWQTAHCVMVNNPDYYPQGDFVLHDEKLFLNGEEKKLTFGNIAFIHPRLFANWQPGYLRLGDVLIAAIQAGKISGEYFSGEWANLGTLAELQKLHDRLAV